MIIGKLPTHAQAALALTNTSFMRLAGASCWESLLNFTDTIENLNYLRALEKDVSNTRSLLACAHCLVLQPRRDFDLDGRDGGTPTVKTYLHSYNDEFLRRNDFIRNQSGNVPERTCNVIYGKVHLGHHFHFSWTDMQEIPRSSSRREFATIYVEPIREAYMHLHRGGYIHVVIDMFKVDSTLCAITRWEVPKQ